MPRPLRPEALKNLLAEAAYQGRSHGHAIRSCRGWNRDLSLDDAKALILERGDDVTVRQRLDRVLAKLGESLTVEDTQTLYSAAEAALLRRLTGQG